MSITEYVDRTLESMRDRPRMWGSPEAIELASLLFIEMECRELYPAAIEQEPRLAFDAYASELRGNLPLHCTEAPEAFPGALFDLCQRTRAKIRRKHVAKPRATLEAAKRLLEALPPAPDGRQHCLFLQNGGLALLYQLDAPAQGQMVFFDTEDLQTDVATLATTITDLVARSLQESSDTQPAPAADPAAEEPGSEPPSEPKP